MKSKLITCLVLLFALFAAPACSGGDEETNNTNMEDAPLEVANVAIFNNKFDNPNVKIVDNGKLILKNRDKVPYRVVLDGVFDETINSEGGTFEYTFSEPGTYTITAPDALPPASMTVTVVGDM